MRWISNQDCRIHQRSVKTDLNERRGANGCAANSSAPQYNDWRYKTAAQLNAINSSAVKELASGRLIAELVCNIETSCIQVFTNYKVETYRDRLHQIFASYVSLVRDMLSRRARLRFWAVRSDQGFRSWDESLHLDATGSQPMDDTRIQHVLLSILPGLVKLGGGHGEHVCFHRLLESLANKQQMDVMNVLCKDHVVPIQGEDLAVVQEQMS